MAAITNSSGAALGPARYAAPTTWLSSSIAALVSLIFHTTVLIAFALVTLAGRWPTEESIGQGPATTEIKIGQLTVERLNTRPEEQLDDGDFRGASGHDERLDETVAIFAEVRGPVASEFTIDDSLSPLAPTGGGRLALAGDIGSAPVIGGGKFDGQATFMGVQAQGQRFCIIADRSGSMFGEKFDYLKREILKTVAGMSPHAELQLVFFSERALPYPKAEWLSPAREQLAMETWLREVFADGDTYPTPAFIHAFALEPPPDTIFFMTDGQFDPRVVYQIRKLQNAAQRKVEIHTITFIDRSSEGLMKLIAAESGGSYRHVAGIAEVEK